MMLRQKFDQKIPLEQPLVYQYNGFKYGGLRMPEVDVSYFRPERPKMEMVGDVEDASSTTAPEKPAALKKAAASVEAAADDSDIDIDDAVIDGELIPPSLPAPTAAATPLIQQVLTPIQKIDFTKCESRQEMMCELNATIPLNEYNLPRYFYRPDLLDAGAIAQLQRSAALPTSSSPRSGGTINDMLEAATVYLDYHHGYPTLRSGTPFWSTLPFESVEAYGAFVAFIEQPGARTFTGGALKAYAPDLLTEWYHTYCWMFRARAYDMYKITHHNRVRIDRIMRTEDNHFLESERLFGKIIQELNNKTSEDWEAIEPDRLVAMLERVSKLQRVSAGLPAQGIPNESQAPRPMSVEVQMRQIAKQNADTNIVVDDSNPLALLQDLDAIDAAQELIIKVSGR